MSEQRPSLSLEITPEIERLLALALEEDVGPGDVTSQAIIPEGQNGVGRIFAKEAGVLCGLDVARRVLRLVDPEARMEAIAQDGDLLDPGADIARVEGSMRSILTAERLALNFLQRLSGIATLTRRYVDMLRLAGSGIQVVDTRKTTPLWRALERHAVRAGGGTNHRFALYDMYLIKNNHIDAAGGVAAALERVRLHNRDRGLQVAIEARDLNEVREILDNGPVDIILLDNMRPAQIRRAANIIAKQARTEITGGMTLKRLSGIASHMIDRVSIGALTHSAPALDISLHIERIP